MGSVLVAPIGDHPAIVTAAVDTLERTGVIVEGVHILCPNDPLIKNGADWIQLDLELDRKPQCPVQRQNLPFADANSETSAKQYLQILALVLDGCERSGNDVHLLLAGGRKNMSALTGIIAQFFPCVKKLWHLLDVYEDDPRHRNLFTVEELNAWSNPTRRAKMHPPAETVNLFEVPFQRFTMASTIRRFLLDPLKQAVPPLPFDAEVEEFYEDIFQQRKSESVLEVRLSGTAFRRFEEMWRDDRNRAEEFRKCFRQMQQPGNLKSRLHGTFGDRGATFHFYKRRRTAERPFFYTKPNPIHLYPEKEVRSVVICGLSIEQGNGQYVPSAEELMAKADREPQYSLSALSAPKQCESAILLAPLGDTPMVASQAYVLLKQHTTHGVATVILLYPGEDAAIHNAAGDLARDFRDEEVACEPRPIPGLRDVASKEDCELYLRCVFQTITEVHKQSPDKEIHLLLSGGRKSMATLNLFAAQRAGLSRVWHTLIKDPSFERRLNQELLAAVSPEQRRDILFLRRHAAECFDLFAVPIFPMEQTS